MDNGLSNGDVYSDKQIPVDMDSTVSCVIQSGWASVGGRSDFCVALCQLIHV